MIKIKVNPHNGIRLPKIGHLPQGEHEVDLKLSDLKDAEGIEIVRPSSSKEK
ncbi:MAG: hypothetical protein Q9M10_07440 [Mariprofundaceae bacterium]|nr:hypothetical protein [Mariprofundaceae bacterium]